MPMVKKKPSAQREYARKESIWKRYNPLEGKIFQILDVDGKVVNSKDFPDIDPDRILEAYKLMILSRVADDKALSWQRQGRLYTFPQNKGQEAAAVGSSFALEKGDWMVPAYRELGAWVHHGVPLSTFYTYYGGNEKGSVAPDGVNFMPAAVPIASQLLHAAGIGYSINLRKGKEIVITYFGDGGTSQGDFHEGLNFASVWKAPVVFFNNNNQYAISLSRLKQTASRTLAQKAIAYDIPGFQVDGNDFLAVYAATREAVARARAGDGPTLIEAVTYRLGPHTTSDDPSRYRSSEEEKEWALKDPLKRLRGYLEGQGLWDEEQEQAQYEAAASVSDEAFAEYEAIDGYPLEDVFQYNYAEMPPELVQQKVAHEKFLKWKESH